MNTTKIRPQVLQDAIAKGDANLKAGRIATYSSPKRMIETVKKRGYTSLFDKNVSKQLS